ncbi:MAG: DUF1802 family protein [Verrucomicrobia bacterium]|nr:DUF1802 family protein [Verrucomicrobiota bacterium]
MDGRIAESAQESIDGKRSNGVPAFKEWAIVCASIEQGGTSLIFRKGGIAEGAKGFRFKHRRFFLFPTYFHEHIERTRLSPEHDVIPRNDCVAISVFVEIEFAGWLGELRPIQALDALHVLQPDVLADRFHYGKPGLHVAFLRAFRVLPVWELPFHPSYGGCRSWITLPDPPADLNKELVLSDEEQNRRRSLCLAEIRSHVE